MSVMEIAKSPPSVLEPAAPTLAEPRPMKEGQDHMPTMHGMAIAV